MNVPPRSTAIALQRLFARSHIYRCPDVIFAPTDQNFERALKISCDHFPRGRELEIDSSEEGMSLSIFPHDVETRSRSTVSSAVWQSNGAEGLPAEADYSKLRRGGTSARVDAQIFHVVMAR